MALTRDLKYRAALNVREELSMSRLGVALIVAWLSAGQAVGAESAAEAIKAFGLVGTWSIDCSRAPTATCNRETGCGARTTYEVPPSGPPMIKNVVGTTVAGLGKSFETVIEAATLIADDQIRIVSVQQGVPGEVSKLAWLRQPGEHWQTVLVKVGSKYRILSAQSEEAKKISARDGFMYTAPSDTKWNEIPTNWVRGEKQTPAFEKCAE
jgi:hypothetical protein